MPNTPPSPIPLAPRGFLAALDYGFNLYRLGLKRWWLSSVITLIPILIASISAVINRDQLVTLPRTGTILDLLSPIIIVLNVAQPDINTGISTSGSAAEIAMGMIQAGWTCAIFLSMWGDKSATLRAGLRQFIRRSPVVLFTQLTLQATIAGFTYLATRIGASGNPVAQFAGLIAAAILILFIPPWFQVLIPVSIAENHGPIKTFLRSLSLTRRSYWRLFAANIIIELILWLAILLPAVFIAIGLDELITNKELNQYALLGMLIFTSLAMTPIRSLLIMSLYLELRVRKEGLDIERGLANIQIIFPAKRPEWDAD